MWKAGKKNGTTAVFLERILKSQTGTHSANDSESVKARVRGRDAEEEAEEGEKGLTESALLGDEREQPV